MTGNPFELDLGAFVFLVEKGLEVCILVENTPALEFEDKRFKDKRFVLYEILWPGPWRSWSELKRSGKMSLPE